MNHRILIIEDEENVGSTLRECLEAEGYETAWAKSVEEARLELDRLRFDLVLLDVGLPDGNGFEIADWISKNQRSTAMVFLTAWDDAKFRVRGLELGAEDYVTKPFHLKELLLRIQNGLKRSRYVADSPDLVTIGQASIKFQKYEIQSKGEVYPLTQKECALLKLLVERRGKVVSRDEILNQVWPGGDFPTSRTIDNFVLRLRKLIEEDSENPHWIKSVRGVGYLLTEEGK